jgi:F-type H+-transporting ATPase subunit epsilon
MDSTGKQIRCVIVTPEQAVLDEAADFVSVPMYDGELGVLPGRAPLIGRLGAGEVRLQSGTTTKRYFIDGGFVQIHGHEVTLLTEKAIPAEALNKQTAETELQNALSKPMKTAYEMNAAKKAQFSARAKLRIANRKS